MAGRRRAGHESSSVERSGSWWLRASLLLDQGVIADLVGLGGGRFHQFADGLEDEGELLVVLAFEFIESIATPCSVKA